MSKYLNDSLSLITLLLISHQGEHWLEPSTPGHPRGQLPHWPFLQGTRQYIWSRDHTRVPENARPQEKRWLLPHLQLLSGIWAHHHSVYMCHLQAQLNRTDFYHIKDLRTLVNIKNKCLFWQRRPWRWRFLKISPFQSLLMFIIRCWKCYLSRHVCLHSN